MNQNLIFGVYAESEEQLGHVFLLAESIREFAGRFKDRPIRVYVPPEIADSGSPILDRIRSLNSDLGACHAPSEALRYYFARKVYAAGQAEADAENMSDNLIWMDNDTVVLREPVDFELESGIGFAYRPVTHNRSGSLFSEPPDPFWSRIYQVLEINENSLFPMTTPADEQTIRAYFNAGLLVVRPENKILRRWGECFAALYSDPYLAETCDNDIERKIFIHQTALVGAVLNHLKIDNLLELPRTYNYPLFFDQQYEAVHAFDSIEDVITLRYDIYFRNPDPGWRSQIKGPVHLVDWICKRLGRELFDSARNDYY